MLLLPPPLPQVQLCLLPQPHCVTAWARLGPLPPSPALAARLTLLRRLQLLLLLLPLALLALPPQGQALQGVGQLVAESGAQQGARQQFGSEAAPPPPLLQFLPARLVVERPLRRQQQPCLTVSGVLTALQLPAVLSWLFLRLVLLPSLPPARCCHLLAQPQWLSLQQLGPLLVHPAVLR